MDFEWDEVKNAANVRKHGIDFADAVRVFKGPVVTWIDDRFDYGEVRQVSIGTIAGVAIVTVVHTDRAGQTRMISARPASSRERKRCESSIRSAADHGRTGQDQG